ncbi:hypothetical protein HDU98_001783 [Podochytrium sp. JEL0797]|nr:hypothetical protein HDU98_001783 [Podochytrium sp. JEL0797]
MSSAVKFTLKRKVTDMAAPLDGASDESKKARAALFSEGTSEAVDGTKQTAPLVIPLKLHNEWTGKVRAASPAPPPPRVSRPSPSPSVQSTASTASLAKPLTKWGLQLRGPTPSLPNSPSPLVAVDSFDPDSETEPAKESTLQERAIEALLNDSANPLPDVLPILQQNAVPGLADISDPKEAYLYDLSLRPEEATLEDFEAVPIEHFGLAMLRGMGYKEELESKDKKDEFAFSKPRPNLLGLGAEPPKPPPSSSKKGSYSGSGGLGGTSGSSGSRDRKAGVNGSSSSKSHGSSSSKPRSKEELKYDSGKRVKILKTGKFRGETGTIVSCRTKSDGIALKISVGREEMRCWSEDVEMLV